MPTSRALLAFAYIYDRFEKTGDLGDGLMALFAPVIALRKGKRFDPAEFAADVRSMYDIELHPYVAEDFAPRLAQAGYLAPVATIGQNVAYENGDFDLPELPISQDALGALLEQFADWANELLGKNAIEIPRAVLKSGLLDRLVQPEFLGLMLRPDKASLGPRTMSLHPATQSSTPEEDERLRLDYLSARFILDCSEARPNDFDLLVAISSGGLAAEVVLTLQRPPTVGDNFASVQIVLDGPLILDALGFGQDGQVKYAKLLIDATKRAKAAPVVFRHTIAEIEGAIRTPLENYERDQEVYGHIGRKLLKNPAFAAYVRAILGKIPELIKGLGIEVHPLSDGERMGLRTVFTEKNEQILSEEIGFYHAAEAKLRDARSIADVLRIRAKAAATSIRDCQIVFVTRNTRLSTLSGKSLRRAGLMSREYFPPCITDRYFAGLLWITQGGGGRQLSRERLIANCSAAVTPRRDVVTKMHRFLSSVDTTMAERFEALMTNERAEHYLMDRTIADVTLITDKNLEQIYRDVELVAGERVAAEKDAVIATMKEGYAAELEQTTLAHAATLTAAHEKSSERLLAESARALDLESRLRDERLRADAAAARAAQLELDLVRQCVERARNAARNARVIVAALMIAVSILLGLATEFVPTAASTPQMIAGIAAVLIVVGQVFSAINYLVFPDRAIERFVKRRRENALRARAKELGVEPAIGNYDIDWQTGGVIGKPSAIGVESRL